MQLDLLLEQLQRVTREDLPHARRGAIVAATLATAREELAASPAAYMAVLRDIVATGASLDASTARKLCERLESIA